MTYQGDTVVNSGTLQFNGAGALANSTIRLGSLGAATINILSAEELRFSYRQCSIICRDQNNQRVE